MAQTMFLPPPACPAYTPSSPDPTPLRLLAFSVAEAALQPDPNSPSFGTSMTMTPQPREINLRSDSWVCEGNEGDWRVASSENHATHSMAKRGRPLWDMAERAKERKEREKALPVVTDSPLPPSPPISPAGYNFILPANSSLAASVAATSWRASPPSLNFSKQLPLYTRSAEPSPVSSTFSTLNQSLPPPEFVPRLSAREFSAQSHDLSAATKQHQRAKSDVRSPHIGNSPSQLLRSQVKVKVSSRHKPTPPSLKQIQAKMSRTHGLGASVGAVPLPRAEPTTRTASEDSIEILKTPTNEKTRTEARISLQSIPSRRPPTPPSPSMKESRLAPFLRQRTNGRLAGARPVSLGSVATPKVSSVANDVKPMLRINPPSLTIRPSLPRPTATVTPTRASFSFRAATASPTDSRFNLTVSIPPSRSSPLSTSPASPTGSVRSFRSTSTASPTLSVPIITCTPAPVKVVKNGVEHDTDEEEGDVVVFDSEMEDSKDRDEREKRGKEMRDRLMLRRRSE